MGIAGLKAVGGFYAPYVVVGAVIMGAVVGLGAATGRSATRWGLAGRIFWAWVLTSLASARGAAITWTGIRWRW